MAYVKFITLTLLGVLSIFAMPATTLTPEETKALNAITEGSNKFAIDLYQAVKEPNKNLIVSPISVQIVLALAYSGAKLNTAREIANVLHLPDDLGEVLQGHKLLIESLASPKLKVANRMFVEKLMALKPDFQQNALKYFLAEVGLVDFKSDAEGSRQLINKWASDNTNDKIKDLIKPGVLNSLTRMVLVNAIYFKADWATQFKPELTVDADFHVSSTEKAKVKMMTLKSKFPFSYNSELKAKILEMPYSNNEFKMVLILPDAIDGLAEVENKLSSINLNQVLSKLYTTEVNVKVPKFKLENFIDLKAILQKMGIIDIFDDNKANLTGIADESLYASECFQKAYIEVSEEGTTAAAATAIIIVSRGQAVRPPSTFHADQPFLYIILNSNDQILFAGRFVGTT